jgi:transposase
MGAELSQRREIGADAARRKCFALEKHSQRILALIAEQPDLTLNEMVGALRKRRIQTSRGALSRFFARAEITVKKKPASGGARARRRGSGAAALDTRARVS